MFLLKLNEGILLKRAVAPLLQVAEMGTLKCSSNGILLVALARDDSFLVELKIESSKFDQFSCGRDGSAIVNLHFFYNSLRRADKDDSVTIIGDYGRIIVVVKNSRTHRARHLRIDLIDARNLVTEPEIQRFGANDDVIVKVASKSFRDAISDLYFYGKTVSVTVTQTKMIFSAVNGEVVLESEECSECVIHRDACSYVPVYMTFSLSHMRSFMNASVLSNEMHLCPSDNSLNFPVGVVGIIKFSMFGR